jgi:hypothetical protein
MFRGYLCHHCNLVLGHAADDPALLRVLADYLEHPDTDVTFKSMKAEDQRMWIAEHPAYLKTWQNKHREHRMEYQRQRRIREQL